MKFTTGSAPIPASRGRLHTKLSLAMAALPIGDDYIEVLLADAAQPTLTRLQNAVAGKANHAFGKGNFATRTNPDRTGIRIWRTA